MNLYTKNIELLTSLLSPILKDKKILIGVTGSIAAFKVVDLIRLYKKCGARVRVVLTESAQQFVSKLSLETISEEPIFSSMWPDFNQGSFGTHHIDLARWADAFLVAPASANFISKSAHGIADDLLSTEFLAFDPNLKQESHLGWIAVVPAMNPVMWKNPAIQHNVEILKSRGIFCLGPTAGDTACGEIGMGRMLEPWDILMQTSQLFFTTNQEKEALVTLGPTRSYLDPVRYLTNRSSGLMGAAFAWALSSRGYRVHIVHGPCDVPLPTQANCAAVQTTHEMFEACKSHSNNKLKIFISTAAPLDWEFQRTEMEKIKKDKPLPALELKKSADILHHFSRELTNCFCLGFAAETTNHSVHGKKKLLEKGCNAIFINDVSSENTGFESLYNAGTWVSQASPNEPIIFPRMEKARLAHLILDCIEKGIT